ncbi:MAG: zinc ribbon domain-containing protein [Candidatus Micrarchaeota archaeon]|nr:zinc ribbon domain-containing protein [Candidatus Micrarchaeota archaeon]
MKEICISCGMPLINSKVRALGMKNWCIYCADAKGKLKSKKEVRAQMIAYFMKAKKISLYMAERYVERHMRELPAWA